MRLPIRHQLLLPLLTLLLGTAAVSAWSAVAAADRARVGIEQQVRNVARTLGEATFPLNARVLEHMKSLSGADYLLVSRDGRMSTLAADGAPPTATAVADDWTALRLGPPLRLGDQTYLGSGVRLRGGDTLYILYPQTRWRDELWEAVRPSLLLGLAVGAGSLALAIGVARRLSLRIDALGRRTRLIADGDFRPAPLPRRDDELRDLARCVNEMAERLAQLQEAMQRHERLRLLGQVSGGLAHQLRNGVTGARLAVQLHARACGDRVDGESLEVALQQLQLVESNLKRFLDLGKAGPAARQPCSLSALVGEAADLLRAQCRHAGTELRWRPPTDDVQVLGDAGQLGHLVLNVLGNAVEAAGAGGWVEVTVMRDVQRALVEVRDSGTGPSAEVAERLFEPFVTGKPEGVGLGLAVARQVAEAHGGTIDWRREAGATCFQVALPVVAESPLLVE